MTRAWALGILICVYVTGVCTGVIIMCIKEIKGPVYYHHTLSPGDKERFYDVQMKYGGINTQVIFEDSLGYYFIRDGHRIKIRR